MTLPTRHCGNCSSLSPQTKQTVRVALSWDDGLEAEAEALSTRLSLPLNGEADALLYLTRERLELRQTGPNAPGPVYADFVAGRAEHRRKHGGGKGQLLARAVFPKGLLPTVVDATAGLGRDAFVLASLGARVTLLERSAIVGALLEDALRRARYSEVAATAARMTLYVGDAAAYLKALGDERPDVIYLDPMYPNTDKRANKNALQKKEMQLFRFLIGADDDAGELLNAARDVALKRVVVKRPGGAPFLGGLKPQGRLESKNTRFDLYLTP